MSDRVKTFWVEYSDWSEITTRFKDGRTVASGLVNKEDGDQLWAQPFTDEMDSRGRNPAYTLPDGRVVKSEDLPAGAVWHCKHYEGIAQWCGSDGLAIWCRLPNGHDWHIDGQANNCTLPDDKVHKCWVRTGNPKTGDLHISKDGHTCSAGAGSILSGDYHGFLRHGYLERC